ncbi:hypothetical protein GYMLUDRAFT_241881 [Collybiopsis luxurians FD-317 M1]|uniref:Unplaced genomic scaffold GYMLUscaffold_16, whole genome shotgun sequence n=1 Tax=Collybiopsis luxurians FD-317 M1 TaxID=944289 RepID=A0A0D0C5J1_9AGAR|nr:hypothetical protein GYMLUDRAFT_241881 [Collybiopsis luxurians FD-317 M1]
MGNDRLPPIVARIFEQSHRWQSVTFKLGKFSLDDFSLNGKPLHFPLLSDIETIEQPELLEFFTNTAPRLKSLRVLYYPGLSIPDNFPFKLIRHLEIVPDEIDMDDLFQLVPNLESLWITEYYTHQLADTKICRTFPSLHTLTVTGRMFYAPRIFNDFEYKGFWFNHDPFMELVQRSSFLLTTLSIQSLSISDSNLVQLLRYFPTLRDFTLSDDQIEYEHSPITGQLIESLHASRTSSLRPQAEPLVPRLHSLTLDIGASAFPDNVVADMVCSRWVPSTVHYGNSVFSSMEAKVPPIDCLREFTMKFRNRERPGDIYEPLDLLEKDGMRLVIRWKE